MTRLEPLTRVRGRIDVLRTERRQLLTRGLVSCRHAELVVDHPRNRLIRAGLTSAARFARGPSAQRCRRLAGTLGTLGVSTTRFGRSDLQAVTIGRNDSTDRDAVEAARLMLTMAIPTEDLGRGMRRDPGRDVAEIRALYEAAVRGFYRATLAPPWRVHAGETWQSWPIEAGSPGAIDVLPTMRTDTRLESPTRRIIVETKFADALKPNQYGKLRLTRDHMFQLYAYVQSQHGNDELSRTAEGILLYPTVDQHLDEWVRLQNHTYRFRTVDLGGPTPAIRTSLLAAIEPIPSTSYRRTYFPDPHPNSGPKQGADPEIGCEPTAAYAAPVISSSSPESHPSR